MKAPLPRRQFLAHLTLASTGLAVGFPRLLAQNPLGANQRVRLAVMGVNSRGGSLAEGFARLPDVEIAAVADVDERALGRSVQALTARQGRAPQALKDFRLALEDRTVDGLVVAAPDHWHAPATMLACQAGKHVYVEKPASHNPREGELMVAAARRHDRVVQVGTQRRSSPAMHDAMRRLHAGEFGPVHFVRAWYTNTRGTIGRGRAVPVPPWLDWPLWQGPAPERPYQDNVVHYHWHWFWHWGTGELGNNGIHALDLCRWGLRADFPRRVTSAGRRYHFDDDQESPDTQVATFDFGDALVTWEGRSCLARGLDGSGFGAAFYGTQGTLLTDGAQVRVFDAKDAEVQTVKGSGSDQPHLENFIDCVRTGRRPNADVEEGHRSTLLCHLGNIAWRTGRTLNCDPKTGHILNDPGAQRLWSRTYRHGWEPKA